MLSVIVDGVSKRYGAVVALDDVSLQIEQGEFFFLLGPSGCGKTTLLRILAGFLDADAGNVRFGERVMNNVPAHRRNTGMVFQNYALWPHMTVFDNVAYGLEIRKIARQERRRRVQEALDLVQLEGMSLRRPNELSGGQQQRVALARALVIRPDVLLLDEPLSNLDAKLRLEMRHELRRIHGQTGITAIYVTHDQKEALSLAYRVAVLKNGRVQQVGTPREIYMKPANEFVAGFIGQANVLRGVAEAGQGGALVRTPFGDIRSVGQLRGPVLCCIRPEALSLASDAPDANRLRATVKDVTYLGDQEQIVLRLAGADAAEELNLLLHHPREKTVSPGDNVELRFAPEDVILVQAS